ncbi:MAG TPA: nuclear transport factor 2 family protein [Lacunisphaera sp.]|nr:nuclear transport factor 2 family protein [Lacunisphaera sp.]
MTTMTSTQDLKAIAIGFLRMAAAGRVDEAWALHVAPGFRHHNPFFPGDAESLKQAMQQNAVKNPDKIFAVQRALQDGDLVAVHSCVRQNPQAPRVAVVHLFRFEQGRIAEIWDVGQPEPENNPNEHGMF